MAAASDPPATGAPLEGRLALARTAVDRAAERRGDVAWLDAAWVDPRTRVVRVAEGRALVEGLDSAGPPRLLAEPASDGLVGERYLLGVDDAERAWFAVHQEPPLRAPLGSDAAPLGLREVGALLGERDAGLLVLAVALANWHATHRHCARCGSATEVVQAGYLRRCPTDGSEHYPRTDPAIIVLVTDRSGERALLGHGVPWPARRFSTLAGFVEPGESAERAVVREVGEEAGVAVGEVGYLGSQPWPFPSSLMLGFTARVLDPDAEPRADGVEVAEVRWFTRPELAAAVESGDVVLPPVVSIARQLIEHWFGAPLADPAGGRW